MGESATTPRVPDRLEIVVSCEHASPDLPPGCDLGVSPEDLRSHGSWDPGAGEAARRLASRLGVFPYAGRYTRLWVDLNRSPDSPEAVPIESFGLTVPGNRDLSESERTERIRRYHAPYRRAVARAVHRILKRDALCLHLAAHSFSPAVGSEVRRFDVGILFDSERPLEAELARRLIGGLAGEGLDARPNEPYPGTADGLTTALRREFGATDYAGIEVEWSQRIVADDSGARRAADALHQVLEWICVTVPRPR